VAETTLSQSLAAAAKSGLPTPKYVDGSIIRVAITDVVASRYQPRTHMDEEELGELVQQIRSQGLLQPVGVRPRAEGGFELVWGHRRVEAFRRLQAEGQGGEKYATITAVVKLAISDADMASAAYIENMGRSALSPLEESLHLQRMLADGLASGPDELAAKVGQAVARVRRLLRLAQAPVVVQDALSGLMVVVGKGDDGRDVRERRSLDLMAAIAFQRLHQHLQKSGPTKKADERVERLIRRSLASNWSKARVEDYVESLVSGKTQASALDEDDTEAVATRPLFSRTPRRFVVEVPKGAASPAQVNELQAAFATLLADLRGVAG
jgi:ParB/RepB/Spo0J family partition protein